MRGEEKDKDLFVMFDLESTGLGTNTAQIIQIAALPLTNCGQPSFNRCAKYNPKVEPIF